LLNSSRQGRRRRAESLRPGIRAEHVRFLPTRAGSYLEVRNGSKSAAENCAKKTSGIGRQPGPSGDRGLTTVSHPGPRPGIDRAMARLYKRGTEATERGGDSGTVIRDD
jgi:hypothetical protein